MLDRGKKFLSDAADPQRLPSLINVEQDYSPVPIGVKRQFKADKPHLRADLKQEPTIDPIPETIFGVVHTIADNVITIMDRNLIKRDCRLLFDIQSKKFRIGQEVAAFRPSEDDEWFIVGDKARDPIKQMTFELTDLSPITWANETDFEYPIENEIAEIDGTAINVLETGYYDIELDINLEVESTAAGWTGVGVVTMSQIAGAAGSNTTQCSWTYDIYNANTNSKIVGPTGLGTYPYQRPALGALTKATYGLWHATLGLIWCNETLETEVC
jgi:hypothetical protein